jgi:integrase/recombinase XerC
LPKSVIGLFLNYLRYERNRSEQTVTRYELSLRDFEAYFLSLDSGLSWASVDADIIRGWMEALMDRGNIASTVNTGLSALRSFYRFALSRKLVEHNPAHALTGPKKRKPLPQFVREDDMNRLLDEEEWGDNIKDVRARTIIILLYEAGLRRGELTGLDNGDVDFAAGQLKVTGKRNKQRIIPFGEELSRQLQHYIQVRNDQLECRDDALFVDDHGRRMSGGQVYRIVRENLTKVTMMKKRSPHVLRHSFATAMLNHDAGLESVKMLLGHESLETTQIYTHTTFEQLKRVYKDAHPRG